VEMARTNITKKKNESKQDNLLTNIVAGSVASFANKRGGNGSEEER